MSGCIHETKIATDGLTKLIFAAAPIGADSPIHSLTHRLSLSLRDVGHVDLGAMLLVVDFVLEDHVFLPHALILFAHNVRVSVVLVQQCIVEKVPDVVMSVRLRKKWRVAISA